MQKVNSNEIKVLSAFEDGKLKSVATKSELARFEVAARATPLNTDSIYRGWVDRDGKVHVAILSDDLR